MKYLLDTHILLWWLTDDPNLNPHECALLKNPKKTIFVSSVSVWELYIKRSLGKVQFPNHLLEVIRQIGFLELPITFDHAQQIGKLPNMHKDPFDRMFVAQAQIEDMVLVTRDENIRKYEVKIFE